MIFGQLAGAAMLFAKFHAGTKITIRLLAASTRTANKICLNTEMGRQTFTLKRQRLVQTRFWRFPGTTQTFQMMYTPVIVKVPVLLK